MDLSNNINNHTMIHEYTVRLTTNTTPDTMEIKNTADQLLDRRVLNHL